MADMVLLHDPNHLDHALVPAVRHYCFPGHVESNLTTMAVHGQKCSRACTMLSASARLFTTKALRHYTGTIWHAATALCFQKSFGHRACLASWAAAHITDVSLLMTNHVT